MRFWKRRGLVLLGYYGAGNLGDDLMLRGLLEQLSLRMPELPVYIISYYSKPIAVPNPATMKVVRARSLLEKVVRLVPLFLRSQMAAFGGGAPFTDYEGDGSFKFFSLARLLGCRYGYISVGFGPLQDSGRTARVGSLLRRSDFLTVRDNTSMVRAEALLGAIRPPVFELVEDLCFVVLQRMRIRKEIKPEGKLPTLFVSWRDLVPYEGEAGHARLTAVFVRDVCNLCRELKFRQICVLPLDVTADLAAHDRLMTTLRENLPSVSVTLRQPASIDDCLKAIASASLFVCVRLHGAICAKALGVPVIGISYSPKVDYFFQSIGSSSYIGLEKLENDPECLVSAGQVAQVESETDLELDQRAALAEKSIKLLATTLQAEI